MILGKLELETVVEGLNRAVFNAYEINCPAEAVMSSRDLSCWKRSLPRIGTEVRIQFRGSKETGD